MKERQRECAHHFRFRCYLTARCCCWLIYVANSDLCPALVACQMQPNWPTMLEFNKEAQQLTCRFKARDEVRAQLVGGCASSGVGPTKPAIKGARAIGACRGRGRWQESKNITINNWIRRDKLFALLLLLLYLLDGCCCLVAHCTPCATHRSRVHFEQRC